MTTQNITVIGRRRENVPKTSKTSSALVSFFRDYATPAPVGEIALSDFLLQPVYRKQIEELRRCADKARRRELKSKLPAITPSGIFSKRCNAGLIRHSGFLCMDVDGQDNPDITDWDSLKRSVSDLPGLWYGGLSASGNGVFLIIKIAYPEKHQEHFASLSTELSGHGVTIDQACKDVARLRGASYDPHPLYSPSVAPYEGLLTTSTWRVPSVDTARTHDNRNNPPDYQTSEEVTAYRVRKLIERIDATGANIADFYPDWYAIGRAIASEFGESCRGWYHIISSKSLKYEQTECDRQYSRCLKTCSQTSIRTFFYYCKQNGITAK